MEEEKKNKTQDVGLSEKLMKTRSVMISGEINKDAADDFAQRMLVLDSLSQDPIYVYINSPGGEAWYMDRLSETLRNAKKPILAIYEEYCESAAYYIGCHGQKLYATTSHDFVGCIGTMCSFWNFEPYFEKLGLKKITAKATNSTRKNKVFEDLKDGKTEEYIKNVLDPMNEQFLAEVKAMRPKLSELGDDAPVLQGESFYTDPAEEVGLIDGKRTLLEAIAEVAQMGDAYMGTQNLYGFC